MISRTQSRFVSTNRNPILVLLVLVAIPAITSLFSSYSPTYYDLVTNLGTGGGLALAAMGLTIIVITGGIDLSVGAVVSLVSVFVGSMMNDDGWSQLAVAGGGVLIGASAGAVNGFFVAYLRMQPIVVTLATLFVLQGIALLIMPIPGGYVPEDFTNAFAGDLLPGVIPAALVVLAAMVCIWLWIKNSPLGNAIYSVGSDEAAALANGVKTANTKFAAYVLAGVFYGVAGLFITAQAGGSDPLVGGTMLIQVFTAVVLGGTPLAGGRGGLVGTMFGAYLLMSTVNTLLLFSLPTFLSPIVDGAILILAVVVTSITSPNSLKTNLFDIKRQIVGQISLRGQKAARSPLAPTRIYRMPVGWVAAHRADLRQLAPSLIALLVILLITAFHFGGFSADYVRSLALLSVILAIVAFGQATVILTGGLDLSIPWAITFCAVVFSSLVAGLDMNLAWAIPMVAGVGILIGLCNGIGITVLGVPPLIMTLAVNGILQGLTLYHTDGTPSGFAPPALKWFIEARVLGMQPVFWVFVAFAAAGTLFLAATPAGRRIYAIGNNARVAYLSGIDVRRSTILAYSICGLTSAVVGILLVGFNGASTLSMGDQYLLPSVAVVVAGGVLITGGRGHYPGVVCGVVMLIALQILIGGLMLPDAVRSIILGMVLLAALVALRDQRVR